MKKRAKNSFLTSFFFFPLRKKKSFWKTFAKTFFLRKQKKKMYEMSIRHYLPEAQQVDVKIINIQGSNWFEATQCVCFEVCQVLQKEQPKPDVIDSLRQSFNFQSLSSSSAKVEGKQEVCVKTALETLALTTYLRDAVLNKREMASKYKEWTIKTIMKAFEEDLMLECPNQQDFAMRVDAKRKELEFSFST
jgi:hypothetical protein